MEDLIQGRRSQHYVVLLGTKFGYEQWHCDEATEYYGACAPSLRLHILHLTGSHHQNLAFCTYISDGSRLHLPSSILHPPLKQNLVTAYEGTQFSK